MNSFILITSAFAAILTFLSASILLKNQTKIYLKSLWGLSFIFFLFKFFDLFNLFINHSEFYYIFGFYFKNFHLNLISNLTLSYPVFLTILVTEKNNQLRNYSLVTITTILTFFFYYFETPYFKVSYIFSCIAISFNCIYNIIIKKEKYEDYYLFKFLMILFLLTLLFLSFSLFYLLSIGELLTSNLYVIDVNINFEINPETTHFRLIFNLFLISFSLYILLTKRILHGKYFYETDFIINNNFKNHWNNVILKKIEKKDLKQYELIQANISNLVLHLIKLERSYINDNVLFSSIEEISQILNQRVIDIDFIFKYNNYLTFNKYMLKINMLKASSLIKKGFLKSNSVSDLAKLFGYNSRSAFYTKFKEINGYSPSKFN